MVKRNGGNRIALVTGGAGFIGSHLCEALLERGDEVICVDNFQTGNTRNVARLVGHRGFTLVEADITRPLPASLAAHRIYNLACAASPAHYQRERRKLAERRKAAFAKEPTGPNQVWQLDFSEFETTTGGTWRLAGCRDYWSKYEHPFHVSPTANQHDAIDAIELALADYEAMFGHPLSDLCDTDAETGQIKPVVTIVTDNGGPFRSFRFEKFILDHPELRHVRTRVRTPGQNGSRERGFGTLKYERLYIDEIDDAIVLACEAAVEAGADFVKTSTGFSTAGATVEHVALMRRTVGEDIGVKASGGVRDIPTLLAMLAEGVTRIGTSSTHLLLDEAERFAAAGDLVVPQPGQDCALPAPTGY